MWLNDDYIVETNLLGKGFIGNSRKFKPFNIGLI